MLRRLLVSASVLAVAAALPAVSFAAPAPAGLPEIAKVSPEQLTVGQVLTIEGQGFVPGRLRNQVVFARVDSRPVFALAYTADRDTLRVRVPAKILPHLQRRAGRPVPTRFVVSVLAARLQPRFTQVSGSPLIAPPPASAGVPGAADCDGDGVAETARQSILGLLVVGLRLVGVDVPDPALADQAGAARAAASELPGVPGVPGAVDVELPEHALPAQSIRSTASEPDCPSHSPQAR